MKRKAFLLSFLSISLVSCNVGSTLSNSSTITSATSTTGNFPSTQITGEQTTTNIGHQSTNSTTLSTTVGYTTATTAPTTSAPLPLSTTNVTTSTTTNTSQPTTSETPDNNVKDFAFSLENNETSVSIGAIVNILFSTTPTNGEYESILFESSNSSIVEIIEGNKVRGVAEGSATIKGTLTLKTGQVIEKTLDISVNKVRVTSVKIKNKDTELELGKSYKLETEVLPSNATDKSLSFTGDNTDVLSIDQEGNLTTKAIGTANITVISKDTGVRDTVQFSVADANQKVILSFLNKASASTAIEETKGLQLKAAKTNTRYGSTTQTEITTDFYSNDRNISVIASEDSSTKYFSGFDQTEGKYYHFYVEGQNTTAKVDDPETISDESEDKLKAKGNLYLDEELNANSINKLYGLYSLANYYLTNKNWFGRTDITDKMKTITFENNTLTYRVKGSFGSYQPYWDSSLSVTLNEDNSISNIHLLHNVYSSNDVNKEDGTLNPDSTPTQKYDYQFTMTYGEKKEYTDTSFGPSMLYFSKDYDVLLEADTNYPKTRTEFGLEDSIRMTPIDPVNTFANTTIDSIKIKSIENPTDIEVLKIMGDEEPYLKAMNAGTATVTFVSSKGYEIKKVITIANTKAPKAISLYVDSSFKSSTSTISLKINTDHILEIMLYPETTEQDYTLTSNNEKVVLEKQKEKGNKGGYQYKVSTSEILDNVQLTLTGFQGFTKVLNFKFIA